jgi:uncharacterized protein YndB with AHSA1/START domain
MISQTAHFVGLTPERLYEAFLSATQHAAMTADGRQLVSFRKPDGSVTDTPQVGDQLLAFGQLPADDGPIEYRLTARLLDLVPAERIVMAWKTAAWHAALDPRDENPDDTSIVVLRFGANMAGAEILLDHVGVPRYPVALSDTGERGPLEEIVNTHWNLLYWEPMKRYLSLGN